jgi:SAM-dependent methyltransferase
VEGYRRSSYGDAFADVYDEWYTGITDADVSADAVADLAAASAAGRGVPRVLELAVGTGRLALPLAERRLDVVGLDASAAMLERLRAHDPNGRVTAVLGDMVDDVPPGPFDAVLLAYNSLFNLEDGDRQAACFAAVAARLAPRGVFVVEAFVPEDPPREGTVVAVRSMTAAEVVLSISEHDPRAQRAAGHLVQFIDGARVRLRPWAIRYAPPAELDAMATAAGLELVSRWEDFAHRPFDGDSPHHVSVYGRRAVNDPRP